LPFVCHFIEPLVVKGKTCSARRLDGECVKKKVMDDERETE